MNRLSLTKKRIPKRLQAVLWSVDVNRLDIERDKGYIIHQILLYGLMNDLRWLFNTYSREEVTRVFVNHPSKMYPKEAFYFIKNFILNLQEKELVEAKYVTAISGPVEPRTAGSL